MGAPKVSTLNAEGKPNGQVAQGESKLNAKRQSSNVVAAISSNNHRIKFIIGRYPIPSLQLSDLAIGMRDQTGLRDTLTAEAN